MSIGFPQPTHLPCESCGASVAREQTDEHLCDEERLLDFEVVQAHPERLEDEVSEYLETPHGRFAAWYAARRR